MLSIIVPAHNEEQLLGETLAAIRRAAKGLGRAVEVLVVDDASTDRTAAIAREHGARVVAVNLRQIAAVRNAGAEAAGGEMLLFVDADTIVTEAAVRAAVEAMEAGAAGGGCPFRFEGRLPLYGRMMQAVAGSLLRVLRMAGGCFLFCTREAFQAAGGFDRNLFAGEETVLSRALGRQGRFVILRQTVTTSGRKLRTHSLREILGAFLPVALTGGRSLTRRPGLDLWYGERRPDPPPAPAASRKD